MPLYRVNIDRRVINWDRFTRLIEAETPEEAEKIGQRVAEASNMDAPDDLYASMFDDEFEDWAINDVEVAEDWELSEYPTVDPSDYPEEVEP